MLAIFPVRPCYGLSRYGRVTFFHLWPCHRCVHTHAGFYNKNKRARVSLTLRLICGYLLMSLQPFLTCIYETLLDKFRFRRVKRRSSQIGPAPRYAAPTQMPLPQAFPNATAVAVERFQPAVCPDKICCLDTASSPNPVLPTTASCCLLLPPASVLLSRRLAFTVQLLAHGRCSLLLLRTKEMTCGWMRQS